MQLINNDELKVICDTLLNNSLTYSVPLAPIVQCLNTTGLRVNEVYELERWTKIEDFVYSVELEKGSGFRIIDDFSSMPLMLPLLKGYPASGFYFRVRQLNYFIEKYTPYAKIFKGSKEIKSHLFRYNKCRTMHDEGYTDSEIKAIICHSSTAVTAQYIYSNIYGV